MVIKITLIQSLITNSVKNETFLRGNVTKATNPQLTETAFHTQAGDEQYHEDILARAMFTQAERLKTWFSEYLTEHGNTADDPLISSEERDGTIDILLRVSDRFNVGYTKTIARLSQKYVEDRMLHLWYAATDIDEKKAAVYLQLAEDDLAGIKSCFKKVPPKRPTYNFPVAINLRFPVIGRTDQPTGTVFPLQLFNDPHVMAKGSDTEITYTLTGENGNMPIDDIILRADNECCTPFINPDGRWAVHANHVGMAVITLFSRHNDQVNTWFPIQVTP